MDAHVTLHARAVPCVLLPRAAQINETWAFCTPTVKDNAGAVVKKEAAVWPTCECRDKWNSTEAEGKDEPWEISGCPTLGELSHCEYVAANLAPPPHTHTHTRTHTHIHVHTHLAL